MASLPQVAGVAFAFLVVGAAPFACADGPDKVSCDGFVLGYEGQVDSRECTAWDDAKDRGEGAFSQLQARSKEFDLVVQFTETRFLSYIPLPAPP